MRGGNGAPHVGIYHILIRDEGRCRGICLFVFLFGCGGVSASPGGDAGFRAVRDGVSENQHAVAVGEEAVALLDGLAVGFHDELLACKGADQHDERALR